MKNNVSDYLTKTRQYQVAGFQSIFYFAFVSVELLVHNISYEIEVDCAGWINWWIGKATFWPDGLDCTRCEVKRNLPVKFLCSVKLL